MERERITISIKKSLLKKIDEVIDGVEVRNRSHAIETLVTSGLGTGDTRNAVILMGGKDATKMVGAAIKNIMLLQKFGVDKIYVALGFLGEKIKQKLGDGAGLGVKLNYIEGEGSGGAIKQLKSQFHKTFIVINSDTSLEIDLEKLISFHRNHKALATIATNDLQGVMGAYILEPEIFAELPKGFSMLESDIFPKLAKEEKLTIYPLL